MVKRNHGTSVPLETAGKQKRQLPRDVRFCRGVTTMEDLDEDNVVDVEVDDQDVSNNPAAEMIRRAEDVVANIQPEYDNDYAEDDLDGVSVLSTLSVVLRSLKSTFRTCRRQANFERRTFQAKMVRLTRWCLPSGLSRMRWSRCLRLQSRDITSGQPDHRRVHGAQSH
jgi:hypothetical protein